MTRKQRLEQIKKEKESRRYEMEVEVYDIDLNHLKSFNYVYKDDETFNDILNAIQNVADDFDMISPIAKINWDWNDEYAMLYSFVKNSIDRLEVGKSFKFDMDDDQGSIDFVIMVRRVK